MRLPLPVPLKDGKRRYTPYDFIGKFHGHLATKHYLGLNKFLHCQTQGCSVD